MRGEFPGNTAFVNWQHIPVSLLPRSASPVPTRQPSQRVDQFDPQPDYNSIWGQTLANDPSETHLFQVINAAFGLPSQRADPQPDYISGWWESVLISPRMVPASASLVPSSQAAQRTDPQPDYSFSWWER